MKAFTVGREAWYSKRSGDTEYITIGEYEEELPGFSCNYEVEMNFTAGEYYNFSIYGDALQFFEDFKDFIDKLKEVQKDKDKLPYNEVVEILISLRYKNITVKEKPKNFKI